MTALQIIIKEAKNIKAKYPKRFSKWTDYVKQASAIYASKHKGKSPVGKKKVVKKAAKKVGAVKRKVLVSPLKKKAIKKVTVKKVIKKAVKKPIKLHQDTKSHNVNIRVMSGIKKIGSIEEIDKGDILVSSWGYDQTNVDFYLVIKKTRLGVSIIPMGKQIIEYNNNTGSGKVLPGEPNFKFKPISRKINRYNDKISIKINTYSYANKWNGKASHFSNYA